MMIMTLKPPVTIEWLRKGRRVEDLKILRRLIDASSEWKVDSGQLSENLFEENTGVNALPETPLDPSIINDILGQDSVTKIVRKNKNNITPSGSKLLKQVESLLPSNLTSLEMKSVSYILSRIITDEIISSFKWPVVPIGLDSLSAALYTINIITQVTGNKVRWLLPIWSLKADEFKLEILRSLKESELKPETLSHSKMRGHLPSLLGCLETAKGDIEESISHFTQAIKIDPDDERSKKNLEMLEEIGSDIVPALRPITLKRLKSAGVRMEAGVKVVEITANGVRGLRNGRSEFCEAETVVLAVGMGSERQLAESLEGKVEELHLVGDCVEPRRIKEAIADSFRIAREI